MRLDSDAFHVPQEFRDTARALNADPLQWLLAGGDDHALAATFPPDVDLPMAWSVVGRVEAGEAGVLVDGAGGRPRRMAHLLMPTRLPVVLAAADWLPRARAHADRVDAWVGPHLERRRTGRRHPVEDFLFDYYHLSPARLRRWHPGAGLVLSGAEAEPYLDLAAYRRTAAGVTLDDDRLARSARRLLDVRRLLLATASRPASYGCFGLHEWAMVYRQDQPSSGTSTAAAARVRAAPTRSWRRTGCAARTSTPSASSPRTAVPLNVLAPDPGEPGAAGAARLPARRHGPLQVGGGSSRAAGRPGRRLLRTRPGDPGRGHAGVAVRPGGAGLPADPGRDAEGKAEYVRHQRAFAERGAVLRQRLVAAAGRAARRGSRRRRRPAPERDRPGCCRGLTSVARPCLP